VNQVATGRLPLSAPSRSVCAETDVRTTSIGAGSSYALVKLRTTSGSSIGRIWVDRAGALTVRADASGTRFTTNAVIAAGTWHRLGLCAEIGTAGSLSLRVNGATVGTWGTNTGTAAVSSVQLGDNDARTATVTWDALTVTGTP